MERDSARPCIVISARDNVATALARCGRRRRRRRRAHDRRPRVDCQRPQDRDDAHRRRGTRDQIRQPDRHGHARHRTWRARAHAQRCERPRPWRPRRRGAPETARDRPFWLPRLSRPDGRVGVRNHVLVVPTVVCSAVVTERIAAAVPARSRSRIWPAAASSGPTCSSRTARWPPTASIPMSARSWWWRWAASRSSRDADRSRAGAGKPSAIVSIQGEGGTLRATAKGSSWPRGLPRSLRVPRESCNIDAAHPVAQMRRLRLYVRPRR